VQFKECRLASLLGTLAPGTYLNLNTYDKKELRTRTVLNKFIVDGEMRFKPSPDSALPAYVAISEGKSF
jgi:hypothetical protein